MIKNNPFNHSSKRLYVLSLLWTLVLLLIGAWWVYLMMNSHLLIDQTNRAKFSKMIMWEGSSFIVLLLLLSLSLLALFLKDVQKTKSLQAFFASVTHELKTPLASMRLQGEVIGELLENKNDPQLQKLLGRLIEDTSKLENQLDKILQLSRIERGGELNLTSVKLIPHLKKLCLEWLNDRELEIICENNNITILADEFALSMILKNLMENSRIHTSGTKVSITVKENGSKVQLIYNDGGHFQGDMKKLGSLFYKLNSSKGSGIGLYLSQKLMRKMNGELKASVQNEKLQFELNFMQAEHSHA